MESTTQHRAHQTLDARRIFLPASLSTRTTRRRRRRSPPRVSSSRFDAATPDCKRPVKDITLLKTWKSPSQTEVKKKVKAEEILDAVVWWAQELFSPSFCPSFFLFGWVVFCWWLLLLSQSEVKWIMDMWSTEVSCLENFTVNQQPQCRKKLR
jgi:hypothetical protein